VTMRVRLFRLRREVTEPNRVDKSIKRHVVLGLVLSSHSPPGSVNPRNVGSRFRPTLLSTDIRQPRRVRRIESQTGTELPVSSLIDVYESSSRFLPLAFGLVKTSSPRTACAKRQAVRTGSLSDHQNRSPPEIQRFFEFIAKSCVPKHGKRVAT
jgi:hypothetical protein